MFAVFTKLRKLILGPLALLSIVLLAACASGPIIGSGPSINPSAPVPVALLVPYGSADPNEQKLAKDLENAARMAVSDLGGVQVDLRVYGTAGNAEKAGQVAAEAVAEGAKIIIGPLHAESANAAALAAQIAGAGAPVFTLSEQLRANAGEVAGMQQRLRRYEAALVASDAEARRLAQEKEALEARRYDIVHRHLQTINRNLSVVFKELTADSADCALSYPEGARPFHALPRVSHV